MWMRFGMNVSRVTCNVLVSSQRVQCSSECIPAPQPLFLIRMKRLLKIHKLFRPLCLFLVLLLYSLIYFCTNKPIKAKNKPDFTTKTSHMKTFAVSHKTEMVTSVQTMLDTWYKLIQELKWIVRQLQKQDQIIKNQQ